MMSCGEVKTRLGELLDGELDAALRPAVEQHLAECPGCRSEYQSLRSMASALAQPPEVSLPAGLWEAIERRLERNREQSPTPPKQTSRSVVLHRLGRRALPAAAVVLVAVALGWLAWRAPWESTAMAAHIDFRPLLEQADGDIEAGISALLRVYGGEAISLAEASQRMKVRIHAADELPGELRLKSRHLLNMGGHHRALAFHYAGPRGQLLLLQCPPSTKKDYGNHECLACQVGQRDGHIVRAGPLRLIHVESENVCVCVVSTLDEHRALPAALDAVRIEF